MEIDQVILMQSSIHNEYNAEPICVQGYITDLNSLWIQHGMILYSNYLRQISQRSVFTIWIQYGINFDGINFVFKLLQTCIHGSQLFCVQIS